MQSKTGLIHVAGFASGSPRCGRSDRPATMQGPRLAASTFLFDPSRLTAGMSLGRLARQLGRFD